MGDSFSLPTIRQVIAEDIEEIKVQVLPEIPPDSCSAMFTASLASCQDVTRRKEDGKHTS